MLTASYDLLKPSQQLSLTSREYGTWYHVCFVLIVYSMQLKQLRTVVKNETSDHTHILSLIRSMDEAMVLSVSLFHAHLVTHAAPIEKY